jgi:hypothetical protein
MYAQALLRQVLQQCGSFGSSFGVTIPGRVAPTLSHDTPVLTLPWLGGASLTFSKGQSDGPMQQARDVLNETIKAYFANNVRYCSLVAASALLVQHSRYLRHSMPCTGDCSLVQHQHVSALQSSLALLIAPATCAQGLNAPPPVIMLDEAQALKHQLPIQDARLLLRWMAQVCAA